MAIEKLYRINYTYSRYYDSETERFFGPTIVDICTTEYNITKETNKGYWIDSGRWVSKTGRKRFAYPTIEEAVNSIIARKNKQLKILRDQIDIANSVLNLSQEMLIKMNE